ncbi:HisA/HisF-related TIM barrel protein [Methylophaga sp. OBS4]|uniref:HisA/HisF-related TIM barrel protein n=1 Tax=Methylophaga sp. OBS4 TaxID=2991935 RepID=UPI00225AF73D|nr:HisA/HisF-related TIM barrel protein [Methylophaga sp. OBS4]MCX4186381.1 HisA/HisF-related TIM barrel protein [Methylophaga sp. OBS4]
MEIIPVIDIREGVAVHARGGNRSDYPPLKSCLTQASEIKPLIADLLDWYPFRAIYIADLDAIESGQHSVLRYHELEKTFPQLEIWLDAGIRTYADYLQYEQNQIVRPVLGSETLAAPDLLQKQDVQQRAILSLDRRHGRFLGDQTLLQQPANWTQTVIAMNLDTVGADSGPGYDWLTELKQARADVDLFAAGGVRGEQDMLQLQQLDIKGVLLASALHTGHLSREAVASLMEQEHRPS